MPGGVSWGRYLAFTSAAMVSMFAGSQMVHMIYKPLADLDEIVQQEKEILIAERRRLKELQK